MIEIVIDLTGKRLKQKILVRLLKENDCEKGCNEQN